MCSICKKFKKGSLSIEEAREELDEQIEYLSEEHIEDIEEMLFEAEDTYKFITEQKLSNLDEDEDDYPLEEDLQEEELWDKDDE